jgi:hypothetical protein
MSNRTGEVVTQTTGNLSVHYFYIVPPTLNYRYELFTLSHGINFYPAPLRYLNDTLQATTEAALKDHLKGILASQHTVNVVHSILAQVRS